MNETNQIPLEVLKPDAQIPITVTTDLYIRLQQLLLEGLPYKSLEDFQTTLKAVHENKATEGLAYHAHSVLFLLNLIETSAKANNLISKKQFSLEDQKII